MPTNISSHEPSPPSMLQVKNFLLGGPSDQAPSQKHDVIAWLSLINNHLDLM
ncbi:BQ5605_C004g02659 [Microbotryum silenes-dioicae]|uniref:BQ5605_C004g02659 protein n=1 Tax=Microbotryum silenes-dioicae TaxID=796604 RepID=A0A2X0MBQ2_9BASI|nr:BQ5605_C004g02659 [Microbotryum silenes-dioicae]